ncbi:MAG: hypothetical protein CMO20_03895 [Thermoplasmata archaeon]|nr:hypothetical protein [Thermoplasmata archaeon]
MVESHWAGVAYRFGNWYSKANDTEIWMPPRLRTRECMFEQWTPGKYDRHIAFQSSTEVIRYLANRAPKSCFYSTAYYNKPNAWKMADKEWKGADLIFDLDGDHLDYVDPYNFPEMLEIIQMQAWKLWDEFLHPEFGFSEKYLHVTFSGHRGFHLHYREPSILGLDSAARRELVSHIRGLGIDVGALMNNLDSSGWKNRLEAGTETILQKLDVVHSDNKEGNKMAKELRNIIMDRAQSPDSKVKSCSIEKLKALSELIQHPDRRANVLSGNYKGLNKYENIFIELVKGDRSLILGKAGETDDQVTVDVKRQIRWPTSLHGKSGMQVTSFPLNRLMPGQSNSFNALLEAIPKYDNKNREMEITVERCIIGLSNDSKEYSLGDRLIADSNMDTFLTLKGWAKPVN